MDCDVFFKGGGVFRASEDGTNMYGSRKENSKQGKKTNISRDMNLSGFACSSK